MPGDTISVTAYANTGYTFTGWTASGIAAPASSSAVFNMPAETVILTANFAADAPVISSVTVSPHTLPLQVERGGSLVSGAAVNGVNNPPQNVTWSVTGATDTGTHIDAGGKLTVGAAETGSLTVTAAASDGTVSSPIVVTVIAPGFGGGPGGSPSPIYSVSIGTPAATTLPPITAGYTSAPPVTIVVINTGNRTTNSLVFSSSSSPSSFIISPNPVGNLPAGTATAVTLRAAPGLVPGTYSETIFVTDANGISETFTVSVTVNPGLVNPFNPGAPITSGTSALAEAERLVENNSPLVGTSSPPADAILPDYLENAVKNTVQNMLNAAGLGVSGAGIIAGVSRESGTYVPAIAGTASNPNGTDGYYLTHVNLSEPGGDRVSVAVVLTVEAAPFRPGGSSGGGSYSGGSSSSGSSSGSSTGSTSTDSGSSIPATPTTPINVTPGTNANGTKNSVAVTVGGGTTGKAVVVNVMNGSAALRLNTDYVINGSGMITINGTYLSTLPVGTTTLTVNMSDGAKATIVITIPRTTETTTPPKTSLKLEDWLNTTNHSAYITGYPEGDFRPQQSVTRAEVAVIFYRLLKTPGFSSGGGFTDVPSGEWYANAVNYLAGLGILTGYPEGDFRPQQTITRAEFATIAARFDTLADNAYGNEFPDVPSDFWAYTYIYSGYRKGWLNGYPEGDFRPQLSITRAETVKVINHMLNRSIGDAALASVTSPFADVTPKLWAYGEVLEAAITHTYTRDAQGKEIWISH